MLKTTPENIFEKKTNIFCSYKKFAINLGRKIKLHLQQ